MGGPSPLPPAGWYPDPSGAPGQRYFDGRDWTEHRAQGTGTPPPGLSVSRNNGFGRGAKIAVGLAAAFILLVIIIGAVSDGGDTSADESSATSEPMTSTNTTVPSSSLEAAPAVPVMPPSGPATQAAPSAPIDGMFIEVLRDEGIPVADEQHILLMAQTLCFSLDQGQPPASTLEDIRAVNPAFTADNAAFFWGAATQAYCPEHNPAAR